MTNFHDGTDPILDGITRALRKDDLDPHHDGHRSPTVTAYVLIADFIGDEGEKRLYFDTMEDQRNHETLGLLDYGLTVERARSVEHFMSEED